MARGPVRITDEVFQVGGPQLTASQDAAIFLFAGEVIRDSLNDDYRNWFSASALVIARF